MLSIDGWLNGLTALLIVVFATLFSTFILIKSIKATGTRTLTYGAFMGLFAGLLWLGPATDFLFILTTNNNLPNEFGLYGILSYMWVAPASFFAISLGADVTAPKMKKPLLIITGILGIIFEYVLFVYTLEMFDFHVYGSPGENLIDSSFIRMSIGFFLIGAFVGMVFIFCGIGTLLQAKKSTGEIRKRFLLLSTSFLLFCVVAVFDALLEPTIILFIVRLGMIACAFFLYYGVKS